MVTRQKSHPVCKRAEILKPLLQNALQFCGLEIFQLHGQSSQILIARFGKQLFFLLSLR